MSSRRVQKIAEAVREVVSMSILTQIKDPRVRDVTVTRVEVSGDLRQSKVHVSIMGNDIRQELALRGLQSAAGFLQSKVAQRIDTRYTPRLEFVLDLGVKKSIEISRILQEVLPRATDEAAPQLRGDASLENASSEYASPEEEPATAAAGGAARRDQAPRASEPAQSEASRAAAEAIAQGGAAGRCESLNPAAQDAPAEER